VFVKRATCLWILGSLVIAGGCGEDAPTGPRRDSDAGTTVPRTDAGPPIAPGEDAGTAVTPDPDAGPPAAAGECTNAADQAAIPMSYGGKDVFGHAEDCVGGCIFEAAATRRACINDCIQSPERVNGAISTECTSCIAIVGDCAIQNCVGPCSLDAEGAECTACLCGRSGAMVSCIGMFMECSGLTDERCG
jgi:hypothetical protein